MIVVNKPKCFGKLYTQKAKEEVIQSSPPKKKKKKKKKSGGNGILN